MRQTGLFNPKFPIEKHGVEGLVGAFYNLEEAALAEASVARGEAELAKGGAIVALTGQHTGRSPKDKFVVDEASVEGTIWRENNPPMAPDAFDRLRADMIAHLGGKEVFVQDLFCGADPEHRLPVRFVNELAWHMLFIRNMMRRPTRDEVRSFEPEWTVINAPSFSADPERHGCRSETVIAISFEQKTILIGNTSYAGENKKSIFSIMNYLLPGKGVMPMHCSANHAVGDPSDCAVFFGLSGTGKTTLSADPNRILVGDDEHGWTDDGVFNFEGGCYAKTINLSEKSEPEIYATTSMFGSVLENVVMDPQSREIDFDDAKHTQNTRVCYPLHYIPNASDTGHAGVPKNIFMLTCDAFGVLPPIARLTPAQAMYHFLSGFTAKVAGNRERRRRAGADLLDLLRRAVHAPTAGGLRQAFAREDRPTWIDLLARLDRMDRRRAWRRPAHADPCHARPADGGARWFVE